MNRGRVGEDRGSKEMDGCPLTIPLLVLIYNFIWSCYDINHILGMNIPIFCNSCEVEVGLLGKIFICKN
jgi:hypothetical protein